MKLNRRSFLKLLVSTAAVTAIPTPIQALINKPEPKFVRLRFSFKNLNKESYILSYSAKLPGKEWKQYIENIEIEEPGDYKIGMDLEHNTLFTAVQLERNLKILGYTKNFIINKQFEGMYFDKNMGGGISVDINSYPKKFVPYGYGPPMKVIANT